MASKPRIALQVVKGALVPIDEQGRKWLNDNCKVGDYILVEVKQARNVRFNRLVHAIGKVCTENIESFAGLSAHGALKRLQAESGIECEESAVIVSGEQIGMLRIPRSIAFDKMDESAFSEMAHGLCRFLVLKYFKTMTED